MVGRRIDWVQDDYSPPDENHPSGWVGYPFPRLEPGDYGKDKDGVWHCRPPWPHAGGCLGNGTDQHKVTEHEDGTITVSPSILITTHYGSWHGYLERGVWRKV